LVSNDDILRVLGRLEEKVDAVADRLNCFEGEFDSDRRARSDSRQEIRIITRGRLNRQGTPADK
jgi:hypothetical protein